jgi:hypothetical protein
MEMEAVRFSKTWRTVTVLKDSTKQVTYSRIALKGPNSKSTEKL